MSTTQTAAEIAASIDLATPEGHNLLALLLNLADNTLRLEHPGVDQADRDGTRLELIEGNMWELTPLGREVAELLRPERWQLAELSPQHGSTWTLTGCGSQILLSWCSKGLAANIAELLNRDALEQAKSYQGAA
jgi:hypothetical protein